MLPDGSEAERVDGPYTLAEEQLGPMFSSSGTQSGTDLSRSSLCWYRAADSKWQNIANAFILELCFGAGDG